MNKNQVDELVKEADGNYYAGKYYQAIGLYEKILAISPENEHAKTYLIKTKAALIRNGSLMFLPEGARADFARAQSSFSRGELELAIGFLKQSIEIATQAEVPFPTAEELLRDIINQLEKSKKKKIFISYARDDYEIASEIYHFLKENGFTPWMDKFDLIPGQNWELEILQNIKSCDFFIACLSQNSVSKRGYVQKELKQALSVLEQFPDGEVYLIPIRINDCLVPESLSSRQWLDWLNTDAKHQLLRALKTH
jgi:tetratricopeptide (TPR) repeat protein